MISLAGQVLIAEDDQNDAYFIQRAFQKCGFTRAPHICGDGMEAIQYLEGTGEFADRTRFPFPKLLLTDLKMPRLNGFELLKWLRDHQELMVVPTIVMTSSKDPSDVKYAYCLGANAYICKPVSPADLEKVIGALLQFWNWCETPKMEAAPSCQQLAQRHTPG